MGKNKKHKKSPSVGEQFGQAKETAWDFIGQEAARRAGRGPQLKGIVHEIALREKRNLSLDALLAGKRTALTHSPNATTVDLVTTQNGRVVERLQLKDCVSDSGIKDIQHRVSRGQYRSARLVGTKETAEKFNKAGGSKKMASSGISSRSTTRAADNAGARVRDKNLLASNTQNIAKCAGGAGMVGAVVGAGVEAWNSRSDLKESQIDGTEYAGRVAKAGIKSGLTATAKTAAALTLKEGAKEVAKRAGTESLKRLAGSNPGTAVAFGAVEQAINTIQLVCGEIDGQEYGTRSVQTAGSTGGAIGGAAAGAAIGSVVPGVGNVAGFVVGGIVGAVGGSSLGRKLGERFFN